MATRVCYDCPVCDTTSVCDRGEDGAPAPETRSCEMPSCKAEFCENCLDYADASDGEQAQYFRCECGAVMCMSHGADFHGLMLCPVCLGESRDEEAITERDEQETGADRCPARE